MLCRDTQYHLCIVISLWKDLHKGRAAVALLETCNAPNECESAQHRCISFVGAGVDAKRQLKSCWEFPEPQFGSM